MPASKIISFIFPILTIATSRWPFHGSKRTGLTNPIMPKGCKDGFWPLLHVSSPKESHSDAAHKRHQKNDTHILSNIQTKEIPKQSYTGNALQMQANLCKRLLLQNTLLSRYPWPGTYIPLPLNHDQVVEGWRLWESWWEHQPQIPQRGQCQTHLKESSDEVGAYSWSECALGARVWKSNNPSLQVLTQSTVGVIGVSQRQKPKHTETSTNVKATLFTTNKEGTNSIITCCYVGSSAHLLVLRNNMHSCMTSIKSSSK